MFQTNIVEDIKTHILFSLTFFVYRVFYEIKWNNIVESGRPETIRCMRIACWITKAADTHSEYVILIAVPLQQWLHERASNVPLYPNCLSCYSLR